MPFQNWFHPIVEYIALQFVHRWKFVPPITTCPLYFYCSFLVGFLQSHLPLMMGHLIWWSARYRRHCQSFQIMYYFVYYICGNTFLASYTRGVGLLLCRWSMYLSLWASSKDEMVLSDYEINDIFDVNPIYSMSTKIPVY